MSGQRVQDTPSMARRTEPRAELWRRPVPRTHAFAASALALALGLAVGLWPTAHSLPSEADAPIPAPTLTLPPTAEAPSAAVGTAVEETLPAAATAATAAPAADLTAAPKGRPEDAEAAAPAPTWQTRTVRAGDSLARLFQREGLSPRDLANLLATAPLAKRLADLRPGDELAFLDEDGALQALRFRPSRLETLTFRRQDEEGQRFSGEQELRTPTVTERTARVTIEDALFLSAQAAGLNDQLALSLAEIFQWDIDFVLDIRKGDRFELLYEELSLDGEAYGTGAILAARFINRGEIFEAVRFEDEQGTASYFTPEGRSLRKAFLRAPVQFTRISSNFNLRRKHPLWNTARPHRGIDYAAPKGTPVVAAGDGKVVKATRNAPSGNYIVLQHGERYQTKYLHLSRFAKNLKAGQRVKQGQVIGYVGATGWATGPHLHYEFLVGGAHQNPRTVDLPKADPIAPAARPAFTRLAEARLAALSGDERLALYQAP